VADESGDDAYFGLLKRLFQQAPIIQHFPQTIRSIGPGEVTIAMPFDARFCHGGGALHGGVLMGLLDNAGYFACATRSGGRWVATNELKVNLLESVRDTNLIAEGKVLREGRHILHAEARAYQGEGDTRRLVAMALGTWSLLPRNFREPEPRD
jgi:uncharacterized protein (TIGR00369 family)